MNHYFRHITRSMAVTMSVFLLASCSGSTSSKPQFSSIISFGDSLTDVGSYTQATVNPATGIPTGGKFTTNPGPIWIENIGTQFHITMTPNVVGFNTTSESCPLPRCTAYAQGGSRVTDPDGVGHSDGELSIPLTTQMDNRLAATPGYAATDLIFVYGGSNDVFSQASYVDATTTAAAVQPGATAASISIASSQAALIANAAVVKAATELAGYTRNKILAKGGQYVAIMTIPDTAATPFGATLSSDGRVLLTSLVNTFNTVLLKAIADQQLNVLVIDANAASKAVLANQASYGVTNATTPACDVANLPGASSLFCNATTLIPTANAGFLFADDVHPTTFGHRLFSDYVMKQLVLKGWF